MQWIIGIAASAAVTVILLITSFEAAMYLDFSYYQKEYEKYHVLEDLDMKMEDVMYVTEEMMAYLRGDRKELKVITTVEGKRLRKYAGVLLVVCVLILLRRKENLFRILSKSWYIVLGIFLAMAALIGIMVLWNFDAIFLLFHELFFDNDLWIFDPNTDYMIRMLPEGLFFDFVFRIGSFFLIGMGMISLLCLAVDHRIKSRK